VNSNLRSVVLLVGVWLSIGSMLACSEAPTTPGTGKLAVNIASTVSLATIDSWTVVINGPSGQQSRTGSPGATIQFTELLPGTYSVLLEGFEGNDIASRGNTNVAVVAGQNTTAAVTVTPVLPELTAVATDPNAAEEGPDAGAFTITRTGLATSALQINVTLGGSATTGTDFQGPATSIPMAAGVRSLVVSVTPVFDIVVEGSEIVTLTIAPGSGYTVGASSNATVTITDAPLAASVTVSPPAAALPPATTVQLSATARDASGNAITRPPTWSTSDFNVATVSPSGLVTAVSIGSATITASVDGRPGAAPITVRAWTASEATSLRTDALNRLGLATSGGESTHLLGGLLSDEFIIGDTDPARIEIDRRNVSPTNTYVTNAYRDLHRARRAAQLAIAAFSNLERTAPSNSQKVTLSEMWYAKGHIEVLLGEHFCSGVTFTNIDTLTARPTHEKPDDQTSLFARAIDSFDHGNTYATQVVPSDSVSSHRRSMALIGRARALMNLNNHAQAAAAASAAALSAPGTLFQPGSGPPNAVVTFNLQLRRYSVANSEGTRGINFVAAADARLQTTGPSTSFDGATPLFVQQKWPSTSSPVELMSTRERDLIIAEVRLRANDIQGFTSVINALRVSVPLTPVPTPANFQAAVDLLFRERAFWLWGTGHRLGDLRRLVKQFGRQATDVFPVGSHHKGGTYGSDVTLPIVQTDDNNPNFAGCIDRNP
jgi:starch-binding outer membrane protein, SusD/RagB family